MYEQLHTLGLISKCIYDSCSKIKHHDSQLIKLSKKLTVAKNNARKYIRTSTKTLLDSVRLHNKINKLAKELVRQSSTSRQEKAFRQNPWQFLQNQLVLMILSFIFEFCCL